MDFSLIEYTLWVMVAFWSMILIDNVYAKVAGGLLLALAVVRAILEPGNAKGVGNRANADAPPDEPPTAGDGKRPNVF